MAGIVVPSPSKALIMNTGEPRLNREERAFVTACRGIAPLGATPARLLKILKYCLSPVSGGKKESRSSYTANATLSLRLMKYDAKDAAATVPTSNGFLRTVPIRLISLLSTKIKTSVTASLHFSLTISWPVLANAFQLIILNGSSEVNLHSLNHP